MATGLPFSQPSEISLRRIYYRRGARRNQVAPTGIFSVSDGFLIVEGGEFSVSDGVLIVDGGEFSVSDGVLVTDGGSFSISDGVLITDNPAAVLTFSPTALAFPDTDPGASTEITVTVTNTGDAAGSITDFSVTGAAFAAELVS